MAIIHNELVWDTKSHGDVFVDECLYVPLSNGKEGFGFGPFGEVVDGDDYVAALSLGWRGERS